MPDAVAEPHEPTRPARRGRTSRLALVGVMAAGAAVLVACDKPLPQVTFQSGSRSVLVSPSLYCFTLQQDTCRGEGKPVTLAAAPGGTIAISVPRTVADNAWIATASIVDQSGKNSPLEGFGSNVVSDNHYARVFVPTTAGSYLLAVTEIRGDVQTGTWTVQVDITD